MADEVTPEEMQEYRAVKSLKQQIGPTGSRPMTSVTSSSGTDVSQFSQVPSEVPYTGLPENNTTLT
jgi:hypothetical protein